ncbi:MAG: archaellum biogenesis protein FlaJ (TadC family) [Gammaproteobacteria bacterium]|jgi:archaellum biogenesis protein FlaJ (TadC family)
MINWIHGNETLIWQLAVFSVVSFVITLLLVPVIVVALPTDYFLHRRRTPTAVIQHPGIAMFWKIAKNALGLVFVAAGIAMLVLPGQGLLTIMVGLMLANFPGKYRLERWLISRPSVLRSMNWIRATAHKAPLRTNSDLAQR